LTQPAHVQTSHPRRKLGRLAPHPETTHPSLKLADFLNPGYALTVPSAVDYLSHVITWPMFGNDTLGDCTAAAAGHQREAWTNYGRGATVLTSDADVLKFYEACSGYIPGRPDTDQGANMQDCCDYWRQAGLAGDRILAFFKISPQNLAEVKAALYLFGGVYVGVNLPTSALDQFDDGDPWDYQPTLDNSIEGGHCVHLGAMDAAGTMTVTTWGRTQRVTTAWWQHFTEECWAIASLDWINQGGLSPEGLDTAALNAQYQAMNPGQPGPFPVATPPAPPPGPTPTPTPTPAPTPTPPVVSVADQALAAAIPASWLSGRHISSNATVQTALAAWFQATGLTPGGK
jgi:hypothetical protein